MFFDLDRKRAVDPIPLDLPDYEQEPLPPECCTFGKIRLIPNSVSSAEFEMPPSVQNLEPTLSSSAQISDRSLRSGIAFDLNGKRGRDQIPLDLPDCGEEPHLPKSCIVCQRSSTSSEFALPEHTISLTHETTATSKCSHVISERLLLAKKHARLRQLRLRIPTVTSGVFSGMFGLVLMFLYTETVWEFAIGSFFGAAGCYLVMISFLPSDGKILIRFCVYVVVPVCIMFILVIASELVSHVSDLQDGTCYYLHKTWPCWYVGTLSGVRVFDMLPAFRCLVVLPLMAYYGMPSNIVLTTMWSCMGWLLLTQGLTAIPRVILGFIAGGGHNALLERAAAVPAFLFGLFALSGKNFRHRAQSWFMSRGEAAVTAAGVAEMLGGKSIQEVLGKARESFLSVRADRILKEHVEDSRPNTDLQELTQKSRLGFVDAFVSHSWHDNSDRKWQALQALRKDFKSKHMREPKLWFDKYSINQNSIEESLACLPVYLSGCTHLWILCGSTYLKRLWCLIEIYIFLEMGGSYSNLHVKILDEDWSSRPSVQDELRKFNPRDATCFTEYDTQRLQIVIETFGHDRICQLVNDVFVSADLA